MSAVREDRDITVWQTEGNSWSVGMFVREEQGVEDAAKFDWLSTGHETEQGALLTIDGTDDIPASVGINSVERLITNPERIAELNQMALNFQV